MKKGFKLLYLLLIFLQLNTVSCNSRRSEAERIKDIQTENLKSLISETRKLLDAIEENHDEKEIQSKFSSSRLAYKKVEYLAELYYPSTAKSINGPALDEVEPDAPDITIPPEGFQVIEELIFPHYDSQMRESVLKETKILLSNISRLSKVTESTTYTNSHIFDAIKLELLRIISLGISGFDSPIAQTSISETSVALRELKKSFSVFENYYDRESLKNFAAVNSHFEQSITFLDGSQDFNKFNRMVFIRDYINPLVKELTDAQKQAGIPFFKELRALKSDSRDFFDDDSFNPNFYTSTFEEHLNPVRVELGKLLFFDPILSGNMKRSCASCHNPEKGFSDGKVKSVAFDFKGQVARNSPTLLNAGLQKSLFYDSRVVYLEDQASDVVSNPSEMHGSLKLVAKRLINSEDYLKLFKRAFPKSGDSAVTQKKIRIALASFTRSLVSLNSRFDKSIRGENVLLTKDEIDGFNLFMGKAKCGTCHFAPLFNGTVPPSFQFSESEVIGVPEKNDTTNAVVDPDLGKYKLYKIEKHRFSFKTPTVRNASLTAPFMHNGIFNTLEEVIDFYNRGGGKGIGIHLPNQTLPEDRLNLSPQEKHAIVTFLKALEDTTALTSKPKKLPSFSSDGGRFDKSKREVGGSY